MQYLITATKSITLDGIVRNPGEIVDETDLSNPGQLVRRGLAIPMGALPSEQAETSSPSSEPAHSSPEEEPAEAPVEEEPEEVVEEPAPTPPTPPAPPAPQPSREAQTRRSMTKAQMRERRNG